MVVASTRKSVKVNFIFFSRVGTTNYISYVSIPTFVGKTRFIVIRIKSADEREYITEFDMDRYQYSMKFTDIEMMDI